MIRVSHALPGDVDKIATIAAEMSQFYGEERIEPLEVRLQQIKDALFSAGAFAHVLLARDGDELVGFASYSFLWPAAGLTRSLFLKELYVAEFARRRGIGTRLMQTLFQLAKTNSCSRVEWQAETNNSQARGFYARIGGSESDGKVFYRLNLLDDTAASS